MTSVEQEFRNLVAYSHQLRSALERVEEDALRLSPEVASLASAALSIAEPPTSKIALALRRPRVGVGCVVVSEEHAGCVLVGERRGSHGAGSWAFPGGHQEPGQCWFDTAAMELEEETGLKIPAESWRFITVTNDVMAADALHYITIFVAATLPAEQHGMIRNLEPDKCSGWHWLSVDEIREKSVFLPLAHFLEDATALALVRSLTPDRGQATRAAAP
jgi:8-oxo-dGTP diphosphatase